MTDMRQLPLAVLGLVALVACGPPAVGRAGQPSSNTGNTALDITIDAQNRRADADAFNAANREHGAAVLADLQRLREEYERDYAARSARQSARPDARPGVLGKLIANARASCESGNACKATAFADCQGFAEGATKKAIAAGCVAEFDNSTQCQAMARTCEQLFECLPFMERLTLCEGGDVR